MFGHLHGVSPLDGRHYIDYSPACQQGNHLTNDMVFSIMCWFMEDEMDDKLEGKVSCMECRWSLLEDYGYSNYTREGTAFYCLLNAHPCDGFDRWYGGNPDLILDCSSYEVGTPVTIDVEKSNAVRLPDGKKDFSLYCDDDKVAEVLNAYMEDM